MKRLRGRCCVFWSHSWKAHEFEKTQCATSPGANGSSPLCSSFFHVLRYAQVYNSLVAKQMWPLRDKGHDNVVLRMCPCPFFGITRSQSNTEWYWLSNSLEDSCCDDFRSEGARGPGPVVGVHTYQPADEPSLEKCVNFAWFWVFLLENAVSIQNV